MLQPFIKPGFDITDLTSGQEFLNGYFRKDLLKRDFTVKNEEKLYYFLTKHNNTPRDNSLKSPVNRIPDVVLPDSASQSGTGGIDLTRDRINVKNNNGEIVQYKFDPAMIQRLQDAAGITPVIIDIRPMTTTVPSFMGVTE